MLPIHIIYRRGIWPRRKMFYDKNRKPASNQRPSNRKRAEQILVYLPVKRQAQHRSRHKGKCQIKREALRCLFRKDAGSYMANFAAVLPAHCQNGAQLNDNLKYLAFVIVKVKQVSNNDQMPCTADR